MLLPSMPSHLRLTIVVERGAVMEYKASSRISFLFGRITRKVEGKTRSLYLILHDIPKSMKMDVSMRRAVDMEASPLQLLPEFSLNASEVGLDLFVSGAGEVFGQRGDYEISIRDMGDFIKTTFDGTVYTIRSSGIGFVSLSTSSIPFSKEITVDRLWLKTSEVVRLDISLYMLFGAFPVINLYHVECGNVMFSLQPIFHIGSRGVWVRIALLDLTFQAGRNADIPSIPYIHVGRGTIKMERVSRHVVLPEPATTLISTFGGSSI